MGWRWLAWLPLTASCGACSSCDELAEADQVVVYAGDFDMGSPADERCRGSGEARRRQNLDYDFRIDAREVTQQNFAARMGYSPSFNADCDDCPVESVTWHEAAAYCNMLSVAQELAQCYDCTGEDRGRRCFVVSPCEGFRLPSESEWEKAARAGTSSALYAGDIESCMAADPSAERIAWYKANSRGTTHPVGTKLPNVWGIFDMSGNVFEWTNTRDDNGLTIAKGGSWYHNAEHARSAARMAIEDTRRLSYVGFRCLRRSDAK